MTNPQKNFARTPGILIFASLLASGCMTAPTLAAPSNASDTGTAEKIIAVGDIHGAHKAFVGLLEATNLIDTDQNWTGGKTHLVSLGDILDRGAESRQAMDLLMKLQIQAKQAGGQVHVVAGNHELMNLIGDLRYVSQGEYAAFAEDEDRLNREEQFEFRSSASGISKLEFDQAYPKGYFAHRAAFAPEGKYGKWLLSLPALAVINDTVFVHGGLPEMVAKSGLAKTNNAYRETLSDYLGTRYQLISDGLLPDDEKQDLIALARTQLEGKSLKSSQKHQLEKFIALDDRDVLNKEGPLWYRGAMMCRPVFEQSILDASLAKLGAKRVVVGHTPSPDGQVHTRYQGKLIQLDTGMLVSHYKGRPSALVIRGGDLKVRYIDPAQNANLSVERRSPAVQTSPEMEAMLNQGSIQMISQASGNTPAHVKISHHGKTYDGRFFSGENEVAAYRLDTALGFDLVPPTVIRTIGSDVGSLQLIDSKSVSETTRRTENISIGGWCPLPRQHQLMLAFDVLTANPARTGDTLFYRIDDGLIYISDFKAGFGTRDQLPAGLRRDAIQLTPGMRQALANLDDARLKTTMNGLLSQTQINALLARRDAMLKKFK